MSYDVVKSKSTALFIIFFTLLSCPTLKKIYIYTTLTHTCPISINHISWQPPGVIISYSAHHHHFQETLPYFNIHSLTHFEKIKQDLTNELKTGFYNPQKPHLVTLTKKLPFRQIIFLILTAFSSILIGAVNSLFHFTDRFRSFLRGA